jgi:hypothetical protein
LKDGGELKLDGYIDSLNEQGEEENDALNAIFDRFIDGAEGYETTGRFGTGFLTTHLLSKIVKISGIFSIPLDELDYESPP